jgi:predicted metal-dependent hydrolase
MEITILIIVLIVIVLGYLIWDTYFVNEVEYVKSTIDNHEYLVRSLPDKQQAADLLANIRKKLEATVEALKQSYPDDPRTKRLLENFRSDKIKEGSENTKYTSYSINKGEQIVFCLRAKDTTKQLVDLNTMVFVALHELGHIATESIGHNKEFWDNFKWILRVAVKEKIYTFQDFNKDPKGYCGIQITDQPLKQA